MVWIDIHKLEQDHIGILVLHEHIDSLLKGILTIPVVGIKHTDKRSLCTTKMAERLGIETQMVNGRRITDSDMLEVVTMVYGGLVNKNLVARLQANGINAMGLTGADANAILSHKRPVQHVAVSQQQTEPACGRSNPAMR